MFKKRFISLLSSFAIIMSCIGLAGCSSTGNSQTSSPISTSLIALNTEISIAIYDSSDKKLLDDCSAIITKYENMLSRTIEGSDIYSINENGSATVSDESLELIQLGLRYTELTQGKFDIAIEPLTALWNFSSSEPKVPAQADITNAVSHVGYDKLEISGNTVSLKDSEAGLDLGAIAKGYIADKIKEYLLSKGVKSALINLGGNILCVGKKPDGSLFKVGLQDPDKDRNVYNKVVEADDISIVTSGTYERTFTENGLSYHHILNPETGYPYDNGLTAVTIISKSSADGDALSTSCFVLGLEKGLELINSIPDAYAMFVSKDGSITYSDGFPQ